VGTERITLVIPTRSAVDTLVCAAIEETKTYPARKRELRDLPFSLEKAVAIYALIDPRTLQIRYIGQSVTPYARRTQHCASALKETGRKAAWLNELRKNALRPVVCVLETVPHGEDSEEAEVRWINWCTHEGMSLLNTSSMGIRINVALDAETTSALCRIANLFERGASRSTRQHLEDVVISLIYEAAEQIDEAEKDNDNERAPADDLVSRGRRDTSGSC
jgi:hypothetical protein